MVSGTEWPHGHYTGPGFHSVQSLCILTQQQCTAQSPVSPTGIASALWMGRSHAHIHLRAREMLQDMEPPLPLRVSSATICIQTPPSCPHLSAVFFPAGPGLRHTERFSLSLLFSNLYTIWLFQEEVYSGCKNVFVLWGVAEVMVHMVLCPEFLIGMYIVATPPF